MESHSGGLVGRSVGRFTTSATGIHALTDDATLTEMSVAFGKSITSLYNLSSVSENGSRTVISVSICVV